MNFDLIAKVIAYGASSASLLVLNKIAITSVPNATALLFVQILSTVIVILAPALCGFLSLVIVPSRGMVMAYVSVSMVFLSTIYSNFKVINAIGVNAFIVLRCGTPLLISYLDWALLGRQLPTGTSLMSLCGIFAGGVCYYLLKYQELSDSAEDVSAVSTSGLLWSFLWIFSFVLDMVYIKYIVHRHACTGLERTLYQNALALPMLAFTLMIEPSGSLQHARGVNAHIKIVVLLSCVAGTVLSYTGMSLRSELSATSFTVLGIVCKMGSAALNEVFVSREEYPATLVCIAAVIVCSAFYKQAPEQDSRSRDSRPVMKGSSPTLPRLSVRLISLLGTLLVLFFTTSHMGASRVNKTHVSTVSIHAVSTMSIARKDVWGVTTTILEVNPAVFHFVENFNASLVVIGDQKTNHTEWSQFASKYGNVVYLSPDHQQVLDFHISRHIPWNHFGRKSLGFLFALKHGAEMIYDFDDDNHLQVSDFTQLKAWQLTFLQTKEHVFNPYPFFDAKHQGETSFVWPRGFPLSRINDRETHSPSLSSFSRESKSDQTNVAVIQSLANHDPDVDAIYRMTRPLPVYFERTETMLIPPRGTFIPWNAQAVLLKNSAFFGLLLPVSVTGRVSDIWRSYITTRLLWETEHFIGFSSPFVNQYRNPHSYMRDLEDEKDLYFQVDDLLKTLSEWASDHHDSMEAAYLDLVEHVVAAGILELEDLHLARAWSKDLRALGYKWPKFSERMPRKTPKLKPLVDDRRVRAQQAKPNAVCLIGEYVPHTEQSLKKFVLDTLKADLFMVVGRNSTTPRGLQVKNVTYLSNAQEDLDMFFSLHSPTWREGSPPGNHLGGLPGRNEGHGAYQLRDRWECEKLIRASEFASGNMYERVGVGRADLLWLHSHPQVTTRGCWVPFKGNDYGGLADHWAWCDRLSAQVYMTAPLSDVPLINVTGSTNTELHLKISLNKHHINVERGEAAFVRLCLHNSSKCKPIAESASAVLYAKHSGKQIEVVKDILMEEIALSTG